MAANLTHRARHHTGGGGGGGQGVVQPVAPGQQFVAEKQIDPTAKPFATQSAFDVHCDSLMLLQYAFS